MVIRKFVFIFFVLIFTKDAFSQFCIDSKLRIDINCGCKRSSCAQLFDNEYSKTLNLANQQLGNKLKPIIETQQNTNYVMNKLFRAEKVTEDEMQKVDQERKKLTSYNDRVLFAYNKFMVNKGKKPIDLKMELALMERRFLASLPPSARKMYLESMKSADNAPMIKLSKSVNKKQDAQVKVVSESGEEDLEVNSSSEETEAVSNNSERQEVQNTQKIYKIESDISTSRENSIFALISKRYNRALTDGYIDMPRIDSDEDIKRKEVIKKDIKTILKQL